MEPREDGGRRRLSTQRTRWQGVATTRRPARRKFLQSWRCEVFNAETLCEAWGRTLGYIRAHSLIRLRIIIDCTTGTALSTGLTTAPSASNYAVR